MLPISRELLETELTACIDVLSKWRDQMNGSKSFMEDGATGLPHLEFQAPEEALVDFIHVLTGEITLVAGHLDSLASVLGRE